MGWGSFLFGTRGRIGRGDFWVAVLLIDILACVLGLLGPLGGLATLPLAWVSLALYIRRLHDTGKSGWHAAVQVALSLGGLGLAAIGSQMGDAGGGAGVGVLGLVLVLGALVLFLVQTLRRGHAGANAYGGPAPPRLVRAPAAA
jgi:uncharacterized membrane protein YhaH (DUF805 family)